MANYDAYEEEFGHENPSSLEESLVEALDSNVQLSINKAVAKALGPLTSHLKGFARQQGWLPSIAAPAETPSQPAKPSKAKAKTKKWPHSEALERLSATVLEEHGYSNSRAQEATSDNSEWAGSDSSQEVSDSDWEDKPSPSKRKHSDQGSSPQAPLKLLTFDPTEIVHPRSANWTPLPEVASYVQVEPMDSKVTIYYIGERLSLDIVPSAGKLRQCSFELLRKKCLVHLPEEQNIAAMGQLLH
ncbi:hypothetical protein NDU88_006501 [Pleurodeles waltl]|uniref:Phosphoprotein n=1 Tax=Pleurodeles waltl TaxID=8319 RepID=A0AAV7WFU7_PLEWA|nr:hypothetical protein NDU88_006501 [Pleurodeles waltl]